MKLKDCKHGVLVTNNSGEVGMVVGITNNTPLADSTVRSERDRALPLIQWQSGGTFGVHPANLELLK